MSPGTCFFFSFLPYLAFCPLQRATFNFLLSEMERRMGSSPPLLPPWKKKHRKDLESWSVSWYTGYPQIGQGVTMSWSPCHSACWWESSAKAVAWTCWSYFTAKNENRGSGTSWDRFNPPTPQKKVMIFHLTFRQQHQHRGWSCSALS